MGIYTRSLVPKCVKMKTISFVSHLQGRSSSRVDGGKMAVAAVALQDHIIRSLPHLHSLSLSGSTHRTAGPALARRAQRTPAGQTQGEEEYVLDPDPPPLTLGILESRMVHPSQQAKSRQTPPIIKPLINKLEI